MSETAPGLSTQPTATTYELGELVPWAWQGRIRVPHFQRGFRWQAKDVLRLFDSIVCGYPVGNLLLWVRKSPAETIKLGQLSIEAPAHDEALWVVDGQQRLTSLANALSPEGNKHEPFNVVYDLARGEFVETPRYGLEPHHIDVPTLFDGRRLLTWFRTQGPEVEDYYDKAEEVSTKLRQYKVPAYLVRQDDLHILTDIFDRMNNYGRRLNRAEIFTALNSGSEEGREGRLDFSRIADNVATRTLFGTIDVNTILAAFLARRGPDPMRDIRTEFSAESRRLQLEFLEDEQTAYQEAEEALVRAVMFLIETAGVPHIALLPYRAQLVVLTRFFAHFPEPTPNSLRLLRRLFWRLSIAGPSVFKGSFTQFSRILSNKIRPGDEEGSLQALLDTMKDAVHARPNPDRFRTNEATAKIVLSAWWSLRPRSLASGVPVDVQSLSSVLGDEQTPVSATPYVFPRLNDPGEKGKRLWAANRLFLPFGEDLPSEISGMLVEPRIDLDEATWREVVKSHLLDDHALDALARGDRIGFLEARQTRVRDQLDDFLARMTEWSYEDTPSLDGLDLDDTDEEENEPETDFSDDRLR
ncbi:DUF262 domain-containing protein [Streptomyces sp. NPDC047000]|uniref:DUF262 domain-containing protein n=1 Tax=Streptomyces sp. NPDC047000 TaxID=3155474 RepID=UPI0033F43C3D